MQLHFKLIFLKILYVKIKSKEMNEINILHTCTKKEIHMKKNIEVLKCSQFSLSIWIETTMFIWFPAKFFQTSTSADHCWDGIHFSDLWGCIVKYFLILCLSLCIYQNFSVSTFLDSFTLFHIMCSLIKKNLVTFLILFIYNSQISRKTLVLFVTQGERDKKTVQS